MSYDLVAIISIIGASLLGAGGVGAVFGLFWIMFYYLRWSITGKWIGSRPPPKWVTEGVPADHVDGSLVRFLLISVLIIAVSGFWCKYYLIYADPFFDFGLPTGFADKAYNACLNAYPDRSVWSSRGYYHQVGDDLWHHPRWDCEYDLVAKRRAETRYENAIMEQQTQHEHDQLYDQVK